ncbi:HD domain-containing phosphohydrolase [Desulfosarcina ovata]|uniref:Two-component system response regulator n=1 Tax=Desulfosarcina ovata subsp. ovata TaxID=2752305 RepID=A0A5K8AIG7_9BACT|nr:HD domain-containing phosphohydrolase [Desulfosarcina ovata]BBO91680.1 two-component system response regulator [Desulfosarcina ovata subsp. ovata]
MEHKMVHTLLLVDDEASILKSLKRLFRREGHNLLTAGSGVEALDLLKQPQEAPISLIISDQRMPGMNGATFLEQSIEFCPDAVRFLLTGYADMDAVVNAVNKGKIHRYLTKPWNDSEILTLAREALAQVELRRENVRLTKLTQRQNAELADLNKSLETKVNERTWALKYQNKMLKSLNNSLEKSLKQVVRLLLSLVESSNPGLGHYMREVAQLARKIAVIAGLEETEQDRVEMAGLVHDIGLLGMADNIVRKDERAMNETEFEAYRQHPAIAALTLSSVEGFEDVGQIILNHHENVDGSGFPEKREGNDIPVGARILAVAADYCTILHLWPNEINALMASARRYLSKAIIDDLEFSRDDNLRRSIAERVILENSDIRYDAGMVRHFLRCIGSHSVSSTVSHLPFDRLQAGMTLHNDLRLEDGRLLLTRGTVLSDSSLSSIQEFGRRGLIGQAINVSLPIDEGQLEHDTP